RGSDLAARAREQAPDLAATAKEFGAELVDTLAETLATKSGDIRAQAKPLVSDASAAVANAADHLVTSAKDTGGSLVPELQAQAGAIGGKVSTGTHAIGEQSKQAANAAGRGARETGALVMWSAAAGTVIYAALLNDRQRQRLKESGRRISSEMREVIADIRGYDEEFA
ncbi:MAG TPA: hypothetical protein VD767_02510, partial [Thermomicrobiales bacterium]|nr:hypothetical protein [Thermomicrobiales bacterium]